MDVVGYILDGLEAALELERELGVRTVECDRGLLGAEKRSQNKGASSGSIAEPPTVAASATDAGPRVDCYRASRRGGDGTVEGLEASKHVNRTIEQSEQSEQSNNRTILDLVFLHDRPLSPKGVEMMAKILNALGKADAPIVIQPPMPQAKVTVVLGGLALKKYFPGMRGEPGQWQKTPEGRDVLITYSPEYILRFDTVTPAVEKIKKAMWTSLKAVRQRLKG